MRHFQMCNVLKYSLCNDLSVVLRRVRNRLCIIIIIIIITQNIFVLSPYLLIIHCSSFLSIIDENLIWWNY